MASNSNGGLSWRDKLAAARQVEMQKSPYLRAAILSLSPREAEGLGTLGVTEHGVLLIDPEAINKWSIEEIASVLEHEVWHLLLEHPRRCKAMMANRMTFNIAGDLAINSMLTSGNRPLPGDCCFPKKFGFPGALLTEEYYNLLTKDCCEVCASPEWRQKRKPRKKIAGEGKVDAVPVKGQPGVYECPSCGALFQSGDGDGESGQPPRLQLPAGASGGKGKSDDGEGKSGSSGLSPKDDRLPKKPGAGNGWDGSGGGRPLPNEPDKGDSSNRSEADLNRVRRETAERVQQTAQKGRGDVPAEAIRWAGEYLKPPKIRWQDKLARACRSAIAYRAGCVDYHYSKPSRRQGGIGYGIGKPILPAMRSPIPKVSIVVDTSGSMGTDELNRCIIETRGILAAVGANVEFVACDAAVHVLKPIRRWQEAAGLLVGGGGTDFRPAFAAVERSRNKPDVLVFLTDGQGPAPELPPHGIHTIWVILGQYATKPCEWGEQIFVDEKKDD